MKNIFIDEDEIKREKAERKVKGVNYYVKDGKLCDKFLNDKYKLSLFHILLDYTKKMYKCLFTVKDFKITRDTFLNLVKKNGKFEMFLEENYVVTNNDKDRVAKEDFYKRYIQHSGLKNVSWQKVLDEIKANKLNYCANLRCKGDVRQGVIVGIREKEEEDDEVKECDELDEPKKKETKNEEPKTKKKEKNMFIDEEPKTDVNAELLRRIDELAKKVETLSKDKEELAKENKKLKKRKHTKRENNLKETQDLTKEVEIPDDDLENIDASL